MDLNDIFDDITNSIKAKDQQTPEKKEPEPETNLMTQMVQECFNQHDEISDKYKCECGTVVKKQIFENENGKCPSCGKTMKAFFEDISIDEKRYNCPRCKSSFIYNRIMEQSCPICSALMDVYAPMNKTGDDKGMLPMSL